MAHCVTTGLTPTSDSWEHHTHGSLFHTTGHLLHENVIHMAHCITQLDICFIWECQTHDSLRQNWTDSNIWLTRMSYKQGSPHHTTGHPIHMRTLYKHGSSYHTTGHWIHKLERTSYSLCCTLESVHTWQHQIPQLMLALNIRNKSIIYRK